MLCCAGLLLQAAFDAQLAYGFNQSPNNRNVSVDTRLNITGSRPEILSTTMLNPITLGAGSRTVSSCNVSVRDYNGFADINAVNATFYSLASSSLSAADDNNSHYTNGSCAVIAGQQGGFLANYTCTFALSYYAVNGSWNCTAFANDTVGLKGNGSWGTNISALFALNVTTLIDYGNLSILDTSNNMTANITNLGNHAINVSVQGYGLTIGDNLSFTCEQGNVSVGAQHFSGNISANFTSKQNLTNALQLVQGGFVVSKPQDDGVVRNTTYWQVYLGPTESANGLCNGTVMFQAENN